MAGNSVNRLHASVQSRSPRSRVSTIHSTLLHHVQQRELDGGATPVGYTGQCLMGSRQLFTLVITVSV